MSVLNLLLPFMDKYRLSERMHEKVLRIMRSTKDMKKAKAYYSVECLLTRGREHLYTFSE